jgi:hypothetical protein
VLALLLDSPERTLLRSMPRGLLGVRIEALLSVPSRMPAWAGDTEARAAPVVSTVMARMREGDFLIP